MSAWTCRSFDGKAAVKIVPPRPRIPWWKGLGADSEEKHEPVSDIDTAAADSLKALDLEWPIREADIVVGNACASLGSRSFNSSLSVVFGHKILSLLLTNSFASGEFHKMGALAKTVPSTTTVIVEPRRSRRHHWVHSSLF